MIDARKHNTIEYFEIPDDGIIRIFFIWALPKNIPKHMPMFLS
jgi:hypothetical protein